jgi:hypothetical protein
MLWSRLERAREPEQIHSQQQMGHESVTAIHTPHIKFHICRRDVRLDSGFYVQRKRHGMIHSILKKKILHLLEFVNEMYFHYPHEVALQCLA